MMVLGVCMIRSMMVLGVCMIRYRGSHYNNLTIIRDSDIS